MPLRIVGDSDNATRGAYNAQVRSYAAANNKPLFDIADIESHDPNGNAVLHNNHEAMYGAYSSDGGHLSTAGEARMAGAIWWLMTRVALAREGVDGGPPPVDAGHDAGRDAGHDAGRDAGHDAGRDAGHDAGRDAGHDAGHDAGYTDGGYRSDGGKADGGSSSGGTSSSGGGSSGGSSGGSAGDGGSDGDTGGCAIGRSSSPLAFAPFAAFLAGAVLRRRANRRPRK
jgi:hypothetical protein